MCKHTVEVQEKRTTPCNKRERGGSVKYKILLSLQKSPWSGVTFHFLVWTLHLLSITLLSSLSQHTTWLRTIPIVFIYLNRVIYNIYCVRYSNGSTKHVTILPFNFRTLIWSVFIWIRISSISIFILTVIGISFSNYIKIRFSKKKPRSSLHWSFFLSFLFIFIQWSISITFKAFFFWRHR